MFEALKKKLGFENIIETKKYGLVTVYLDENTRFGNAYFVTATKRGIQLAGFIDKKGVEIIPIDEMTLEECFYTEYQLDICFGFKLPNIDTLKYYHVQKQEDNNYKLRIATNPLDQEPICIRPVKEDRNTWVFEKQIGDSEKEYAIYRPCETRMLTCFFDELSFDIPNNPYGHYAYVCNYITAEIEKDNDEENIDRVPLTTVSALIGYDGNFTSLLLDAEDEEFYNSYFVNGTSTSREYSMLLYNLQQKYLNRYLEKEERINNTIDYLFNNYNQSLEPPKKKKDKPAKILEFRLKQDNSN